MAKYLLSIHSVEGEAGDPMTEQEMQQFMGRVGRLFEPIAAYQSKRMGKRSLAAFKYLVEEGRPPQVKHSQLPKIPLAC